MPGPTARPPLPSLMALALAITALLGVILAAGFAWVVPSAYLLAWPTAFAAHGLLHLGTVLGLWGGAMDRRPVFRWGPFWGNLVPLALVWLAVAAVAFGLAGGGN